jgi:hypothetical protein
MGDDTLAGGAPAERAGLSSAVAHVPHEHFGGVARLFVAEIGVLPCAPPRVRDQQKELRGLVSR